MEGPTVSVEEEDGEWRVVRTWKGKPSHVRRLLHKSMAEDGRASYCPGYGPSLSTSWDAEEEDALRQKLQKSLERVRSSVFYKKLIEQMQRLQILESLLANARRAHSLHHDQMVMNEFLSALSSFGPNSADHEVCTFRFSFGSLIIESGSRVEQRSVGEQVVAGVVERVERVELVVLGVGSIRSSEVSRCQMALALLLKDRFASIGKVLVYDPVLSAMERGLLTALGCTAIGRDDKGRRAWRAAAPTLFYMPHCGAALYNNLLHENLDPWRLGWVSILGNSFQRYQDSWSVSPQPKHARPDCLLAMQKHATEHSVNAASFPCLSAFNDMSWHLFPIKNIFL